MGSKGTASFTATVSSFGKNTGIVVPPEIIDTLGSGKRPAVVVTLNGYEYPTTIGAMGGQQLISVSAAIRAATGLNGGDPVTVSISLATGPRSVEIPSDLAAAFKKHRAAEQFFGTLSNSVQRYHVDNINSAKAPDTRARRVDKAIELFLAGKPR